MPDVTGLHVDEAMKILERNGIPGIVIERTSSQDCEPDVVCLQNPKPRTRAIIDPNYKKQIFVGATRVRETPGEESHPTPQAPADEPDEEATDFF